MNSKIEDGTKPDATGSSDEAGKPNTLGQVELFLLSLAAAALPAVAHAGQTVTVPPIPHVNVQTHQGNNANVRPLSGSQLKGVSSGTHKGWIESGTHKGWIESGGWIEKQ
jgi:hypothetical protein